MKKILEYEKDYIKIPSAEANNIELINFASENFNNVLISTGTLKQSEIQKIDNIGIDGDYIESQSFGYLAIRSYLGLPISFPKTTGCKEPSTGGVIVNNY